MSSTKLARMRARGRAAVLKPRDRWHLETKRALIRAIDRGLVTEDEIMAAHGMGPEEIAEYRRKYGRAEGAAA